MEANYILAINPGATSTKIAVYRSNKFILLKTLRHSSAILSDTFFPLKMQKGAASRTMVPEPDSRPPSISIIRHQSAMSSVILLF